VTKQEHDLMLYLFVTQMQVSAAILELLRSRGIAESGDVEAFSALALEGVRVEAGTYANMYASLAKQAGVQLPPNFA